MACFILFLLCHWAADFTHLSRPYMLAAKRIGYPLMPILHHAMVHGILIFIAALMFKDWADSGLCAFIVTITHWGIDILKGRINVWIPSVQLPTNVFHWYIFGADQLLHIVVLAACFEYFIR